MPRNGRRLSGPVGRIWAALCSAVRRVWTPVADVVADAWTDVHRWARHNRRLRHLVDWLAIAWAALGKGFRSTGSWARWVAGDGSRPKVGRRAVITASVAAGVLVLVGVAFSLGIFGPETPQNATPPAASDTGAAGRVITGAPSAAVAPSADAAAAVTPAYATATPTTWSAASEAIAWAKAAKHQYHGHVGSPVGSHTGYHTGFHTGSPAGANGGRPRNGGRAGTTGG
jgi:hypothetical protein